MISVTSCRLHDIFSKKNSMKRLFIFLISISSLASGATFTVTSNLDAGAGTLREAITLANGTVGIDNINFNFGAPTTITLTSCLPAIVDPVIIDGYTDGASLPGAPSITVQANCINGFEFNAGSTGSTIKGLVIYGCNRGIYLINSSNHTIQGNFIGTNSTGTAVAPSIISWNGIEIDQSSNNLIGGLVLGEQNLISGCNEQAIRIQGSSLNNIIRGNLMGTNRTGTASIPNGQNAVFQIGASNGTLVEFNLISGNGQRAVFSDNCTNLIVQSNLIGTNATGNAALGNGTFGLEIVGNSHNPSILNNVIGASTFHGIAINNCLRPIIKGNKIGVGFDGTSVIGNSQHGIMVINCLRPTIGGALAGEGNIISNNSLFGIQAVLCDSLRIKGNRIGLDANGLTDRGNNEHGINISDCRNPTIGGTTLLERNYIAGNTIHGITINGALSDRAIVKGNVIGLGTDLSTPIGNGAHGIEIIDCEDSYIGGLTALERNYIAQNGANGLTMERCDNSTIAGNYVGVDGTGLLARGNNNLGIRVFSSNNMMIGGTSIAARNISSANESGIVLDGTSSNGSIKANFAGLGADGTTPLGNKFSGIYLLGTCTNITVGGSTFAERNVCSSNGYLANTGDGIRIEGPDGNIILGNYCGVDSTGTLARPNHWGGISMNESDNNTIGGPGLFEGNIVAANLNEGFYLRNANNNTIIGNYIGTDKTGTLQLGNEDWGINISPAGPNFDNIIGGSLANRNIIAYNRNVPGFADGGPGVYVNTNSHRNLITYNKIYCNEQRGIERNGAGNDNLAAPVVIASLANSISGTADAGNTIHIYSNTTTDAGAWCDCEGETFIGTTTADGSGNWSFTHNLGLSVAEAASVSSTQTNPANSTSAFSSCSSPLPVNYLSFTVKRLDANSAEVAWSTANELNNDHFVVWRSIDGVHFEPIGTINGNGTSYEVNAYSFTDGAVPDAQVVYYRLQQVDINGKSGFTEIKSISGSGKTFEASIENQTLELGILMNASKATIRVISSTGQVIFENEIIGENWIEPEFHLPSLSAGVYLVQLTTAAEIQTLKVLSKE
jgi:parallel beta-helix repeat protein